MLSNKSKLSIVMLVVFLSVALVFAGCAEDAPEAVEDSEADVEEVDEVADDDEWPNRTIELVTHSGPGGNQDALLRALSDPLSEILGVPVIVRTLQGANHLNAYHHVAESAPDGHTIVNIPHSTFGIHHIDGNLEVPLLDFIWFNIGYGAPSATVTGMDVGPADIDELLERGLARFADRGHESGNNSWQIRLYEELGVDFRMTPGYDDPESLAALARGEQDFFARPIHMLDRTGLVGEEVRFFIVASDEPHPDYPDVTYFGEINEKYGTNLEEKPDSRIDFVYGLPPGTPDHIVQKVAAAFKEAMESEIYQMRAGADSLFSGFVYDPAEVQAYMESVVYFYDNEIDFDEILEKLQ